MATNNTSPFFTNRLQELRKVYDSMHAEIVETQREQIINLINRELDSAYSNITGDDNNRSQIEVQVCGSDFADPLQKETVSFLEELGFKCNQLQLGPDVTWNLVLRW